MRFVSVDPHPGDQGDPMSLNEYVYCRNNPINYTDPDGDEAAAAALTLLGGATAPAWLPWVAGGFLVSAGIIAASVAISNKIKNNRRKFCENPPPKFFNPMFEKRSDREVQKGIRSEKKNIRTHLKKSVDDIIRRDLYNFKHHVKEIKTSVKNIQKAKKELSQRNSARKRYNKYCR